MSVYHWQEWLFGPIFFCLTLLNKIMTTLGWTADGIFDFDISCSIIQISSYNMRCPQTPPVAQAVHEKYLVQYQLQHHNDIIGSIIVAPEILGDCRRQQKNYSQHYSLKNMCNGREKKCLQRIKKLINLIHGFDLLQQ